MLVVGFGLGALIAASSVAFAAVKWLGVAYLLFLGVQQWRAPAKPLVVSSAADPLPGNRARVAASTLILRGWMINAVNPKGTLFLLAVVPQFLDLSRPLGLRYFVIGATVGFTDLVVMAGYTALAAKVLHMLKTPSQMRLLNRVFGSLFVAAAVLLATFKKA